MTDAWLRQKNHKPDIDVGATWRAMTAPMRRQTRPGGDGADIRRRYLPSEAKEQKPAGASARHRRRVNHFAGTLTAATVCDRLLPLRGTPNFAGD